MLIKKTSKTCKALIIKVLPLFEHSHRLSSPVILDFLVLPSCFTLGLVLVFLGLFVFFSRKLLVIPTFPSFLSCHSPKVFSQYVAPTAQSSVKSCSIALT